MSPASSGPTGNTRAPLAGRSVIVTRAREQMAGLAGPLEALGAEVLPFPVIEIVEPDDWRPADAAIARLGDYDWIVLTSTNAVDRFIDRVHCAGVDDEVLGAKSFAVVGSATAESLRSQGFEPAIVPEDFRAEGLIDEFRGLVASGIATGEGCGGRGDGRVLIPRALEARETLPDALRELGFEVDVVPVYRTVAAEPDPAVVDRLRSGKVDAVTFTSGSTVRNFIAVLEHAGLDPHAVMSGLLVASVGPVTTATLRKSGYRAVVEAPEATMPSLAAALANALARPESAGPSRD